MTAGSAGRLRAEIMGGQRKRILQAVRLGALVVLAFGRVAAGAAHGAPLDAQRGGAARFTAPPQAVKAGDRTKISFAVSVETDVAVAIVNAQGLVVRHLAAGLVGTNAPAPLKAGALEQSLEWDGTDDDGKEAEGGPFRVRVGLGLKAAYSGTVFMEKSGPDCLTGLVGLAPGPGGRLYAMGSRSGWLYWPANSVHVFRRDGAYEKTIKPFPSNLPPERLNGTGAFINRAGRLNPLIHRALGMTFYPYEDAPAAQMAFAAGNLWLTVVPSSMKDSITYRGTAPHLAAIDPDGGIPFPGYAGPPLGPWKFGQMYLAPRADGKTLFMTGFGKAAQWDKGAESLPMICRVEVPERGPAQVVFGDPRQPGDDSAHLSNPRGVAVDGQGHLLVCDFGNNRVVVLKEADGSYVKAFPVEEPSWIGAHPKTGALYVCSKDHLLKLSGWQEPSEQARLALPPRTWKDARYLRLFALDASAEPAVLWVGSNHGSPALWRCEDQGAKFSELAPAGCYSQMRMRNLSADPLRREVACQVGHPWSGGGLVVMDEATGQTRKVPGVVGEGTCNRLGPDGCIYGNDHARGILRYEKNGRAKPFEATKDGPEKGQLPGKAGSSGTTAWERDFYVDRKGDIYTKIRGTSYHGLMHVDVYGQDGRLKRTAIWGVTDGSYGPKVDSHGNLYMMECVKPVGEPFPEEFKAHVTDRAVQHWYDWMYGSIVKFGPAGGNVLLPTGRKDDRPRAEPVSLPESVEKRKVYATFRKGDSFVQGALWMAPGVAHCGDMGVCGGGDHCHCTGCDFNVDDFGRSFAPDNGRQRVTVLDANGSVITHFGAYGNQDYCGPDSYVVDPAGKFLRPRGPRDPADLKSPFADPEIAFNFIVGLAVTDRHVYIADVANCRVLRVKLDYAASETVDVP